MNLTSSVVAVGTKLIGRNCSEFKLLSMQDIYPVRTTPPSASFVVAVMLVLLLLRIS